MQFLSKNFSMAVTLSLVFPNFYVVKFSCWNIFVGCRPYENFSTRKFFQRKFHITKISRFTVCKHCIIKAFLLLQCLFHSLSYLLPIVLSCWLSSSYCPGDGCRMLWTACIYAYNYPCNCGIIGRSSQITGSKRKPVVHIDIVVAIVLGYTQQLSDV